MLGWSASLAIHEPVRLPPLRLPGTLDIPAAARGIVVFAHGSDSSRLSPRNIYVAEALRAAGLATLLFDLLSEEEAGTRTRVFDIELLATRLTAATGWLRDRAAVASLPLGLFGASTSAAAALVAAANAPEMFGAIVSRGGRPDLAGGALPRVQAPTLLIVGGHDSEVLALNRVAFVDLVCTKELEIVPGATPLFEERGALDQVIDLARNWFLTYLNPATE